MLTHTLGFPRIGGNRELKWAVESYWNNAASESQLLLTARNIRENNWLTQQQRGIDLVPSGDFSLYDSMLDLACALGVIPPRFKQSGGPVGLDTYFLMARGGSGRRGIAPMEMTKWFDTNYHYIVPEFRQGQTFHTDFHPVLDYLEEAEQLGLESKAVLPGPLTFMALGKAEHAGFDKWTLFDALLESYCAIVDACAEKCRWIQIDEPLLATDLNVDTKHCYQNAFNAIDRASGYAQIMLATYFGGVAHNIDIIRTLPVDCLHIDCMRASGDIDAVVSALPERMLVSLGVVDGRNIWRTDLDAAIATVGRVATAIGEERVMIAPSCSLQHVPVDITGETDLDPEIASWMAFAVQKCDELRIIADTVSGARDTEPELVESRMIMQERRRSTKRLDSAVRARIDSLTDDMLHRASAYKIRACAQKRKLKLPPYPTTTIGSFPQTDELRRNRRRFRNGEIAQDEYEARLKDYIRDCIQKQEEIGLDVLVHGEPERNDMVEYFAELLHGFCFTRNGWVQSYGTRCVKPPVIYGDISRPEPMTVRWSTYAQSLTLKLVKGMLTGPVTILSWSFVRDDQPRQDTCRQIALVIRDEVCDLERAGIPIIQIDEPAFREGAPLRRHERGDYYDWASECFRLATSGVSDETQIHTHMCYSEFNDIMEQIASLDADVISIEASRSNMDLLDAFRDFEYPNEIGPGVYDIHSARIPDVAEIVRLLGEAVRYIPMEHLWINPDCGLKTRRWEEVLPALKNMVAAARDVCAI